MSKKHIMITSVILLVILFGCIAFHFRYFFTGPDNAPVDARENADFGIADIQSLTDADADGVDDQTDILAGARAYIAKRPRYRSKYYADSGYPDDNYGVCTDVVANALLSAGYDLRQLVYEDICNHPKDYAVDEPDINIDFRRVRNLSVYFSHTATALTTDIHDIAEWQGGDIVIFRKHIGIVSDKRNENGVPYVIHHNDPLQRAFEEDILETRTDIVGHYRVE